MSASPPTATPTGAPVATPPAAGPVVLAGPADEDWTGDARFHEYTAAVDPLAVGAIAPVPIRSFPAALHDGPGTRLVPLDLAPELGVDGPATTPALDASFVVLDPGDALATAGGATSELYHCLRGSGSTTAQPVPAGITGGPSRPPRPLAWTEDDFFTLPATSGARHVAGPDGALLYRVTDRPLLHYLGAAPDTARFSPTRYDGHEARARLALVEQDPAAGERNRVSILLGSRSTPQTLTVTPTLWAMFGVLPAGRVQRPHRHQSVAVDLITACEPGCFTLLGTQLDDRGDIVDPVQVDWEAGGVFLTPPGLWHSHHNRSGRAAHLVPVQDAGLHTYLRSLDIRFPEGSPGPAHVASGPS